MFGATCCVASQHPGKIWTPHEELFHFKVWPKIGSGIRMLHTPNKGTQKIKQE